MDLTQIHTLTLPLAVLFNNELNDREKLTLCLLGRLCELNAQVSGHLFTYTKTPELERLFNKSKRTLLRAIANLEKKGFIHLEYKKQGVISLKRIIYMTPKATKLLFNYEPTELLYEPKN
jgi:hypothetical protein